MTSHVIAYRSLELLFGTHTFHFICFFEDFNCVFTQIRCLSRVLSNVNKGMRFASGTIKSASSRQTMGVDKYASTFPMASCNKIKFSTCPGTSKKQKEQMSLYLSVLKQFILSKTV